MADLSHPSDLPQRKAHSLYARSEQVQKRHQKGMALRILGMAAISVVLFFLCVLLWSIVSRGIPALWQYQAQIELFYDPAILNEDGGAVTPEEINAVSLRSGFERGIFANSLKQTVDAAGIDVMATVTARYVDRASETLGAVGLMDGAAGVLSELRNGTLEGGDVARLFGQAGSALRAAQSSLEGDDLVAAQAALDTAIAALSDGGFAAAADQLRGFAANLTAETMADVAVQLSNTGLQTALLDAAGLMRAPAEFDDTALASMIFAANRRDTRDYLAANPDLVGQSEMIGVPVAISLTRYLTGELQGQDKSDMPPGFDLGHLAMADAMVEADIIQRHFHWKFFTNLYSQSGEITGIGPALMGSLYMMLVVLVFSLIFGVAASIYLEEFAPKNKFTDFIEINIANLAAVPSIVFGILGAAILFAMTDLGITTSIRGTALLGGFVLSLMTLPTIVIATRAALKAVPPSIREAALGVGASKVQAMFHHILPLAAPGILTGTIIGIAQALGETAPLLLIGLSVSTGADLLSSPLSGGLLEQTQSMPTVVYLLAQNEDAPVRQGLAQSAIIVMLILLFLLNFLAIILRRRFERRW
ncbi:phosphate ABC transporter permease PstA [Rhodobacteraceae bacterium XHP0102]|nr:phosphate ABC transporter permease PstA [Rhodobacteraceae bacterium XHP0102]